MKIIAGRFSNIELLDSDSLANHHFHVAMENLINIIRTNKTDVIPCEYWIRVCYVDYDSYASKYTVENHYNISYNKINSHFADSTNRLLRLPNDTSYICVICDVPLSRGAEFVFMNIESKEAFVVRFALSGTRDSSIMEFYIDQSAEICLTHN